GVASRESGTGTPGPRPGSPLGPRALALPAAELVPEAPRALVRPTIGLAHPLRPRAAQVFEGRPAQDGGTSHPAHLRIGVEPPQQLLVEHDLYRSHVGNLSPCLGRDPAPAGEPYPHAVAPSRIERAVVEAAGREVAITNPAKVYFPEAGITKLDVVRYYLAVAEGALRGAGGRPNVLVRYADGIHG